MRIVEAASTMILAGGREERMGIFCKHRAKPILPFAGNAWVIDFPPSNCIYSQLGDIAVLTDYKRSALAIYLRRWALMNDSSGNISALEPNEGSYLGRADDIYQNLQYMHNHGDDLVVQMTSHEK